ncbi:MAG: hypothetical protein K0R97_524 [Oerskovia sp.]|jgi:hypothetical protein|nr:hypothetical protein [Oerskovia sp.]
MSATSAPDDLQRAMRTAPSPIVVDGTVLGPSCLFC